MANKKSKDIVKLFHTFPQRAGKVDDQITKFMEEWVTIENEVLIIKDVIPHQANTDSGEEHMILVVFERDY